MAKPILTSEPGSLTQGVYGQQLSTQTNDYSKILENATFRPALMAMGMDIASIDYYLEVSEKNDWQHVLWQTWIDKGIARIIQEMAVKAWVYGHCYAEPKVNTFVWGKYRYVYPMNFYPLDMKETAINQGIIEYGDRTLREENLMRFVYFVWSGAVYPMGGLFAKHIEYLTELEKSMVVTTMANSAGLLLFMHDKDVKSTVNDTNKQNIAIMKSAFAKTWGMSGETPGYIKDVKLLQSQTKVSGFKESLNYVMTVLLQGIRSQYMLSSVSTPGTYGTAKTLHETAITYINSLAERTCEGLNRMVQTVAKWNKSSPTVMFKYNPMVLEENDPDSNLKLMQAIKILQEITDSINPQQRSTIEDRLGLPTKLDNNNPTDNDINEDERPDTKLQAFLTNKRYQIRKLAKARKQGSNIKITGMKKLSEMLNLNKNSELRLEHSSKKLENKINSRIYTEPNFNESWSVFIDDISRYIREMEENN